MNLHLADAEAVELRQVIAARLDVLLNEIAHADVRAARDELKIRYDRLNDLLQRLNREAASQEAYA